MTSIRKLMSLFLVFILTPSSSSNDTKDVVVYVSGYITRSLLKNSECQDCSELHHKDKIETCFASVLNRGGLQLPSSILYSYVESAFCCIEYLETRMLATKLPLKLLICSLLKVLSNQWDTTFSCDLHYPECRNRINCIIANLYLTGMSREISETRRKDQVESFKANKRKSAS